MIIAIIGGGAAGFFAALAAKRANPDAEVFILERSNKPLSKVRISGGGRCNVTHACFDPRLLVTNYPRGSKELLGPFHHFGPTDTIEWFARRKVRLKTEKDGRMFPVTDSSQTIIDCFYKEAEKLGVKIRTGAKVRAVEKGFTIDVSPHPPLHADKVILATGSAKQGWEFARSFGHTLVEPVPSLFTLNVPDFPLAHLAGISAEATLKLDRFKETGPLLITHWGLSGPVALKISAFAARYLAEKNYEATLTIQWGEGLPRRLRQTLGEERHSQFQIRGKTTNKAEFVTAGGIELSEVNFKTMESKLCPGLYFCGEILNIDGITGGFNFQNAWTTGFLAGGAVGK